MLMYRGTCAVGAIIILLSLLEPLPRGRCLHEGRETFVVGAVKIVLSLQAPVPQGRVLPEGKGTCIIVSVCYFYMNGFRRSLGVSP